MTRYWWEITVEKNFTIPTTIILYTVPDTTSLLKSLEFSITYNNILILFNILNIR